MSSGLSPICFPQRQRSLDHSISQVWSLGAKFSHPILLTLGVLLRLKGLLIGGVQTQSTREDQRGVVRRVAQEPMAPAQTLVFRSQKDWSPCV